jgi:SAM-dependent methyltransferase
MPGGGAHPKEGALLLVHRVSPMIPAPPRSDNEAKYRSRNPVVRYLVARFLHTVEQLVAERRPARVLEVGCGEGVVMGYLRARHPGLRVDGVEPDPRALATARARNPGSLLLQGDACELPIGRAAYDLVLCLEVLEHLPEPDRALVEVRRVARRGCILSVPHEPFFRLGNVLRGKNLVRFGDPPDHLQHWNRRRFESFCRQHVRLERTVLAFPWLVVAAAA